MYIVVWGWTLLLLQDLLDLEEEAKSDEEEEEEEVCTHVWSIYKLSFLVLLTEAKYKT